MKADGRLWWVALGAAMMIVFAAGVSVAGDFAFVTTTDFITGSSSVIQLDGSYTTQQNAAALHSDAVARCFSGLVYVVNRFGADNIQILDPESAYSTLGQFTVGVSSDPHDINVIDATRAYVTRYNTTDLWIVDPSTGSNTGSIDLSGLADADGTPEMDQMARVGNQLFVTIQRLDRLTTWGPVGTSYVAVVDIEADTLIDVDPLAPGAQSIELTGSNPASDIRLHPWEGKLYVSCVGFWGLQDGGIEVIDPVGLESDGFVLTEAAAGGDINDFIIISATSAYAIVTDASFYTELIAFDPSTGSKTETLYAPGDYVLNDIELSPGGDLFLADRTPTLPGIRVFDTGTNSELTTTPVDVGLPPFDIAFSTTVQTGIRDKAPNAASLGDVYPNPFNPSTRIPYTLKAPSHVTITVVDVVGRKVETLVDAIRPAGAYEAVWNGLDREGTPAASGVYFARMEADGVHSAKKMILLK